MNLLEFGTILPITKWGVWLIVSPPHASDDAAASGYQMRVTIMVKAPYIYLHSHHSFTVIASDRHRGRWHATDFYRGDKEYSFEPLSGRSFLLELAFTSKIQSTMAMPIRLLAIGTAKEGRSFDMLLYEPLPGAKGALYCMEESDLEP